MATSCVKISGDRKNWERMSCGQICGENASFGIDELGEVQLLENNLFNRRRWQVFSTMFGNFQFSIYEHLLNKPHVF